MKNSRSEHSNTGYKGISFLVETTGRFEAYIVSRMRNKHNKRPVKFVIGHYDTLKEAVKAREEFIQALF